LLRNTVNVRFKLDEKTLRKDKIDREKEETNGNNKEIKEFYETTEEYMKKIPKLKPPTIEDLDKLSIEIPNCLNKKIVVFDLDETLVHCETKAINKCEIVIKLNSSSTEITKLGLNIRPYLRESLLEIKKYFMIFVFTASQQALGDVVLDYLDPENEIFDKRLYRNNCYQTKLNNDTIYIKDLRILKNVDLKDVVIVDNSVLSFSFLLDNGIPILPYYGNKNDTELIILVNYLKHLSTFDDMRIENRKNIKLDILYRQANSDNLISEDNHYLSSKNSYQEKEFAIKHFSSENSNFSNFSNEYETYKKSDDNEKVCYLNSFSTNRSDKTFKDQMINILDEYYKNFNKTKLKNTQNI
jgi:Dullard-like phosphatase family protein